MKQVFYTTLLFIICIFFHCCDNTNNDTLPADNENQVDSTNTNAIDPNSVISIKVVNAAVRSGLEINNPRFITVYAWDMMTAKFRKDIPSFYEESYYQSRDTIENKIKFKGYDVINDRGELGGFLFAEDIVLRVAKDSSGNYVNKLNYTGTLELARDTVAYIPNKTMIDNLKKIQELYDKQDFDACYQLFDTAYQFIPITGAEWLKLKAEGKE